MSSQLSDMTSMSNFCDVVLFLLLGLVTGLNFMSISSLILELWQFSCIRDWPEIRKLEILPSDFCPNPRDWNKLVTPNLGRISLIKFRWLLQNAGVKALTVFELLRENQQIGGVRGRGKRVKLSHPHTQIRVNLKFGTWNLVTELIRISRIRWWSLLFLF